MDRVALPFAPNLYAQCPRDLSDLLLQDVEVDIHQSSSRIEDALASVQNLVQRGRLGLEHDFEPTRDFIRIWDAQYVSFKVWGAFKRRQLYQETWIQWEELHKARSSEGFRFLESQLRQSTLALPKSGGLVWWSDTQHTKSDYLSYLQSREFASFQSFPEIQGVGLLGQPALDARLSWLSRLPVVSAPSSHNLAAKPVDRTAKSIGTSTTISDKTEHLPVWVKAAIKMGTRFVRIAAAKTPPAVTSLPRNYASQTVCCGECENIHPPVIDEYYFWLANSHFFDPNDVTQNPLQGATPPDPTSAWENPTPALLNWTPEHSVHLYWCRVHFGRFEPPRRSDEGVPVPSHDTLQLGFSGRTVDSLIFTVNDNTASLPAGSGFRYDMARDSAVVLAQAVPDTHQQTSDIPKPLPAYPFFIYFDPGAPLVPLSNFSMAVAIAGTLRSHCRFEESLRWYALVFNPLQRDNTWAQLPSSQSPTGESSNSPPYGDADLPCCPTQASSVEVARNRAVLLEYLETLLQWGDILLSQKSRDAFQQASGVFNLAERILGTNPKRVHAFDRGSQSMTLNTFKPSASQLNPRLLALYDRVGDRRWLAHDLNSPRMCSGPQSQDLLSLGLGCFGDQVCLEPCQRRHPYRFTSVLPQALELARLVSSFGTSLLSAFEKADAEYLETLRMTFDRQISSLTLEAKKNQFRDSDWETQALEQGLAGALTRYNYYQNLISNGLNAGENGYQDSIEASLGMLSAETVSEGIAEIMSIIPDISVGAAGAFGSPLEFNQLPIGSKLANSFNIAARILNTIANITQTTGSLEQIQGEWARRVQEWNQQLDATAIELQQIECQKLAAGRRRAISVRELNIQVQQIDHSVEIQDFMRDKFTSQDLYIFLQQETAALYRQSYNLALQAAREAQLLFWYERRDTLRNFLPESGWNNLREGLLAGERLELALQAMDKAYMEANCREYELTKHISLRMLLPAAFLLLKTTGFCEIDIPEWMFDLDYPGHYMRRIKNVSLTIPCVTGPYIGINCRLSLLSSVIRINPELTSSEVSQSEDGYAPQRPNDPRFVRNYAATESIATSGGQNDSGLFELKFDDQRYLPFEYAGAVSRWRIELPPENNQFQLSTLSDLVLHLKYTAREGGDSLRQAANKAAQQHLPGGGWRLFDIRNDFPDAWQIFQRTFDHGWKNVSQSHKHPSHRNIGHTHERDFHLRLNRNMFPFLTGDREVNIVSLSMFIEIPCAEVGEHIKVKYYPAGHDFKVEDNCCEDDVKEFDCIVTREWQGLYHGMLRIKMGPIQGSVLRDFGTFRLPEYVSEIWNIYMLCRYEVDDKNPCEGPIHLRQHRKVWGHHQWMQAQ